MSRKTLRDETAAVEAFIAGRLRSSDAAR